MSTSQEREQAGGQAAAAGDELSALQAKHKELSAAHDALRARQEEGEAERSQLQATNDEMRQHIRATAEHDGESTAAWQRLRSGLRCSRRWCCVLLQPPRNASTRPSAPRTVRPHPPQILINAVWNRTVVIVTTRVGTAAALTDRIATLEAALQQEQRALAALKADHEAAVEKHRGELAAAGDAQQEAVEGKLTLLCFGLRLPEDLSMSDRDGRG